MPVGIGQVGGGIRHVYLVTCVHCSRRQASLLLDTGELSGSSLESNLAQSSPFVVLFVPEAVQSSCGTEA